MNAVESPAYAAVLAAQGRLTQARRAVIDRELDVQKARAALPRRIDLVAEDPVLGAAMAPTPDEVVMLGRIDELQDLVFEAKDTWNREGRRVLATQTRGAGLPLDEDPRFVAADQLLGELMVELNGLRRTCDLGARIRVFTASVQRHDDALAQRESLSPTPEMKRGLRDEIARRVRSPR